MYLENEKLITVEPIGKVDSDNFIPKGTIVEFIMLLDNDGIDLEKSLVAVKFGEKDLVTLETNVKIRSWWRRRKAFKQFNNQMLINSPRLRRYHPNILLKIYFRIHYFIADRIGGK